MSMLGSDLVSHSTITKRRVRCPVRSSEGGLVLIPSFIALVVVLMLVTLVVASRQDAAIGDP